MRYESPRFTIILSVFALAMIIFYIFSCHIKSLTNLCLFFCPLFVFVSGVTARKFLAAKQIYMYFHLSKAVAIAPPLTHQSLVNTRISFICNPFFLTNKKKKMIKKNHISTIQKTFILFCCMPQTLIYDMMPDNTSLLV